MASGTRRDNDSDYVAFKMRMRHDKKTKATKLPRVLKKLQEEDPTIEVDLPNGAAYENFHGTPTAPCFLFTGASKDVNWVPTDASLDTLGVHLTFKVSGGTLVKQFTIAANVTELNVSKLHESKLHFFLGEMGQIKHFSHPKRTSEESRQFFGYSTVAHVISWTKYGEYGSGPEIADNYDEESRTAFTKMEALRCGVLQDETTIHLVGADVPGLFYELQAIQARVTRNKILWHSYLDARGTP